MFEHLLMPGCKLINFPAFEEVVFQYCVWLEHPWKNPVQIVIAIGSPRLPVGCLHPLFAGGTKADFVFPPENFWDGISAQGFFLQYFILPPADFILRRYCQRVFNKPIVEVGKAGFQGECHRVAVFCAQQVLELILKVACQAGIQIISFEKVVENPACSDIGIEKIRCDVVTQGSIKQYFAHEVRDILEYQGLKGFFFLPPER